MCLRHSCCPGGFGVLRPNDLHESHAADTTNVLCYDHMESELKINETRHCSTGEWEEMVLGNNLYEIRNNQGYGKVKYDGRDCAKVNALDKTYEFELNWTSYCVSNILGEEDVLGSLHVN